MLLIPFTCLAVPLTALGSSPVVCPGDTECRVSIYRSALPSDFAIHTIVFVPPVDGNGRNTPIAGNRATFRYDGISAQVVCDGSWHDFIPGASQNEIRNRVMCAIGSGGTSVHASFILYDQDVYSYPYQYCPALDCCPELTGSSEASPYCHTDGDDSACKWQRQNFNDSILSQRNVPPNNWVVYGKTAANNLTFLYDVERDAPYSETDYICAYDANGNGAMDLGEMSACIQTGTAYLCPVDAADCTATYEGPVCPDGSALNAGTDRCEANPIVHTPDDGIYDCPAETSYSPASRLCEANPECRAGSYNAAADRCYTGDTTCPYGPRYACVSHQGRNRCSAQECAQYGSAQDEGTEQGSNDKHDDGQVDDEGNCLGTVYIFNGHDRRCRSDGASIGFKDCCADEDYLFGLGQCKEEEKQLAHLKARGMCHYVGEYCSKKLSLLFGEICIEHSRTYCCFNSKLGRIIQEQGRPQLKTFDGWGQSESPYCRGMRPEEFEMVDFSRIDLSEWYGDIVAKSQAEISSSMQDKVQKFYDNIEH